MTLFPLFERILLRPTENGSVGAYNFKQAMIPQFQNDWKIFNCHLFLTCLQILTGIICQRCSCYFPHAILPYHNAFALQRAKAKCAFVYQILAIYLRYFVFIFFWRQYISCRSFFYYFFSRGPNNSVIPHENDFRKF